MPDERVWDMSFERIANAMEKMYAGADAPKFQQYRAVLDARAANASHSTARWTKRLAVVTVLLVVTTGVFSVLGYLTQRDVHREARRQSCLARIELLRAVIEFRTPEGTREALGDFKDDVATDLLRQVGKCGM